MPAARVRLLGRFDLRVDGAQVPLESARAESLLAHLLLHRDEPQPRGRLAALLWPESTEAQARTNLRHVLHTVRARLPDPDAQLDVTPRALRWRPGTWVDVEEFERLLDGGRLAEAVALYTGDLLDGCDDEWLRPERDRLRARLREGLARLAELARDRGDLADALRHAERLLREDPLREETYRLLMRLHDARGERARALAVYHECSSTLERELGVAPSAATRAAYDALLPGRPAAAPSGSAALVGRATERASLAAAWRSAERAQPRFVLVGGEPGVGKTRLAEEFRAWCARRGATVADARCYAAEGVLAYGPVVAWLRSPTLWPRVQLLDAARLADLARLLPELAAGKPPGPLPEAELRHRLLDAVAAAVLGTGGPVLLSIDDLQYADRESCALLHYLLRAQPAARLMVVATARREEIDAGHPARELLAGLHALDRCTEIDLPSLNPADTALLAERLTGAPLSEPDARRLHEETEGNALFVVEALRAGWEPGRPPSPRVQAVIEARLAQLGGPARELVEVAATIGREFRLDVLADAADAGDDVLARALDELWRRRIVRERGPDTYDFAHDRIREVAAGAVGPVRRRRLHARIAAALARAHATDPGPVAARVAAHHEQAGEAADAVRWYRVAAEAAQLLHADRRAVELLDRALAQLAVLPAGPDRDATELAVRTAILAPLALVDGYASPATSAHQARARELARATGTGETPPLLRSLALTALTGSDFAAATRAGQQLQAAGERDTDDVGLVEAGYVLGIAAFWQADFVAARRHFEDAIARYRPEHARTHLIRYAQDPKVVCLGRLANTLWFLGHPAEAFAAREAALAWARKLGHPLSTGVALLFGALLDLDAGDEQGLRRRVAAMADVVAEQQPFRLSRAVLEGYVAVLDGAGPERVDEAARTVPGGEAAPGQRAVVGRVRLAAAMAAGDPAAARAAAEDLLAQGGAARVWEPVARRVLAGGVVNRSVESEPVVVEPPR